MSSTLMTKVEEGEFWWGGAVHDGAKMPLSAHSVYAIDLRREGRGNQSAPFFVSSHGRTVWSEEPFAISFDHGILRAEGSAPILLEQHGATLREGYLGGMKAHFPFDGRCPERAFYVTPQFNTWVELRYDHNRQAVLDYAHSLLSNGYAPGVLMIDDTWQEDYGVWRFHPGRFPDPAGMVKELHEMGFAVMVWAVPVVSPDSAPFRKALNTPGALIRGRDGKPVLIEWWNGYSAAIDFTNEAGRAWMREQLSALQKDYGVDGFKFDGGGAQFYLPAQEASGRSAADFTAAWFDFAAQYAYNEVKDTWKAGGKPLNQRLRDKTHAWDGEGLSCILPDAFNAALTGHPFLCPDMVGGGEWTNFEPGHVIDQELIVRCAQVSALFPMMQFSVAPWRVLSPENGARVLRAAKLHQAMGEKLWQWVQQSARTGEPILAPMAYAFPGCGMEEIADQFALPDGTIVAPVLQKGALQRTAWLPEGNWQDESGARFAGGEVTVSVDPDRLPRFFRIG